MAYANRLPARQRGPILGAVVVLQAVAVYGLVNGLSEFIPPLEKDPPLIAVPIPLPGIEKPEPKVTDEALPLPMPAPSHRAPEILPRPIEPPPGPAIDEALGDGLTGQLVPVPQFTSLPDPQPQFAPKSARPLGSPGLWVTPDDYPPGALRQRQEGVSRFRLTIGADGRVRDCAILASSGHAELDRATCANLVRRGRFEAASDDAGKPVAGTYTGAVRWKLPRDF